MPGACMPFAHARARAAALRGQVSASKQRITELRAGIEQARVQRALAGMAGGRCGEDEASCSAAEQDAKAQIEQARVCALCLRTCFDIDMGNPRVEQNDLHRRGPATRRRLCASAH